MSILKDYWLKHRIKTANAKLFEIRNESNYVKLQELTKLLKTLPHQSIDASIAAMQSVRSTHADIISLIDLLKFVSLKLQTNGQLSSSVFAIDAVERNLDSLFIHNKTYVPFSRITDFLQECEKLVKLTDGIRHAKVGQDEYHFRIISNLFATCVEIQKAILENLQSGKLGK